jgi:hypothetical protein
MARLFSRYSEAVSRTMEIAGRCIFSMDELAYQYPEERTMPGLTPQQALEKLTWEGVTERYPEGLPDEVRPKLEHELRLIERLQYAPYFLTVNSIVRFARSKDILCQGRGSAANHCVSSQLCRSPIAKRNIGSRVEKPARKWEHAVALQVVNFASPIHGGNHAIQTCNLSARRRLTVRRDRHRVGTKHTGSRCVQRRQRRSGGRRWLQIEVRFDRRRHDHRHRYEWFSKGQCRAQPVERG